MQLFNIKHDKLNSIDEQPFKLEKDIQNLFEKNLQTISNLKFVKSEFAVKDYRIDTLAYDTEANAFVIIEYKKGSNLSVIDQGVTYLNLMLEYKANFIIEYNESWCSNNSEICSSDNGANVTIFQPEDCSLLAILSNNL